MRYLVLIAFLAAAPATAATRTFTVPSFEKVRVIGPYNVRIAAGSPGARATGEQAALDRLEVRFDGGWLTVRPIERAAGDGARQALPATIELSTPSLNGVAFGSRGDLSLAAFRGDRLSVALTSTGNATLNGLAVRDANFTAAGSGTLTVAGTAETLVMQVQGTGQVDASGLKTRDADLTMIGTGKLRAAASGTAKITAYAGEVAVSGPARCTIRKGGSAVVNCGSDQQQR